MKVTRQEFESKIFNSSNPSQIKWVCHETEPMTGDEILFVVNNASDCAKDYSGKMAAATHIWFRDSVTYDSDGTFLVSPVSGVTPTYTSSGMSINFDLSKMFIDGFYGLGGAIETKIPKCECGAHAVGSSQHSTWCNMKGDSLCG